MSDIDVRHQPDDHRWVALDGSEQAGLTTYERRGDVLVFVHTEVDDRWEGRGVGSTLVRGALDDVRRDGLQVVAQCPFVASWIEHHPDYADLLAAED